MAWILVEELFFATSLSSPYDCWLDPDPDPEPDGRNVMTWVHKF